MVTTPTEMTTSSITYKVIKSEEQYDKYCKILEKLVCNGNSNDSQDEIERLTLLIEDWDDCHQLSLELDPVQLLQSLMKDHELNQNDLATITGVGKSYISEILNYRKRMSAKVIRNIASHFKIRQESLNKSYGTRTQNDIESESMPVIGWMALEPGLS